MNLKEIGQSIYENAKSKGFYDNPPILGTRLMLCVSELSEALEADRKDKYAKLDRYFNKIQNINPTYSESEIDRYKTAAFEECIKDTFEDEIADTIIRLLDLCTYHNIDIEKHILLKMEYNSKREFKHGGKKY